MSECTAVYRLLGVDGVPVYIGMSRCPANRIYIHRARAWWAEVADLTITWYPSKAEAFAAERAAIRTEHPQYNIAETPLFRQVSGFKGHLTPDEHEHWVAADTYMSRQERYSA